MKVLQKQKDKDFIILNLTDPQLGEPEWVEGHQNRKILEHTVTELVQRVKPDFITITGDLAWAGQMPAYEMLGKLIESFQIPWAFVWGNHDNQGGAENVDQAADFYLTCPHCIYEKGDKALGNGNYVICIQEEDKIVEALIMMDSNDRDDYVDETGNAYKAWAKLKPPQIEWYRQQVRALKDKGCQSATLMLHIPIYAYKAASLVAYKEGIDLKEVTIAQAEGAECWNKGYEESIGVQYEQISCYPEEDGMLSVIQQEGLTKRVVAGHDHVCNFMITYEGVQLVYALKTGAGCYWDPRLNGGTVLKIGANGVYEIKHEYVDTANI